MTDTDAVPDPLVAARERHAKVAERFAGEWSAFHANGRGPFQTNNARRVAAAAARIIANAIRREEP